MASKMKPFSSKDAVVCRGVGKIWAEGTPRAHEALLDIDLDIKPGEFVVRLTVVDNEGGAGKAEKTLVVVE